MVLGSTGSIGVQALSVAKKHNIKIDALTANKNADLLEKQAREFSPKFICISDENKYKDLKDNLFGSGIKVYFSPDGILEVINKSDCDILLNSIVGIAGLLPTIETIKTKKTLALANKESLVTGGQLVIELAKANNVKILPVDSEHSAIFQCLQDRAENKIKKVILTASGGPFFGKDKNYLKNVTIKDALNHPNWSMGQKITVDSATLMNKGLELIEAVWLFGLKPEQIEIVVHRQSVLHSAVEFEDNSVIGQMGVPDMKIPIQYAIMYPRRHSCDVKALSFTDYGTLTFEKPDFDTFECLQACIDAIKIGGTMPAFINGVNEKAVEAFLQEKISFLQIGEIVKKAMTCHNVKKGTCFEEVLDADLEARNFVREYL